MTRNSPTYIGMSLGTLALFACHDTTTEPGTSASVSALALASDTWVSRAELPHVRFYLATAAVTGASGQSILYAIGGLGPLNRIANTVDAYDVVTNTWTAKAPLPTRVYATNGAGVINGKIYISGGIGHDDTIRRQLYMYDPATDTWTQKRSMPTPGHSGVTGVINGQLYVLTSCACVVFSAGFYRYDPVANQWASLPRPRSIHREGMGGIVGGKFYVAGGNHIDLLEVYDPATNEWTTKTAMPSVRTLGAGAALGGKLYVIGGREETGNGNDASVATTSVYDPVTDTWTNKTPMPTARYGIAASRVFLNGQPRIEVVGETRPGTNLRYMP
jgi:N-acetylneuraminic acid mutarotase